MIKLLNDFPWRLQTRTGKTCRRLVSTPTIVGHLLLHCFSLAVCDIIRLKNWMCSLTNICSADKRTHERKRVAVEIVFYARILLQTEHSFDLVTQVCTLVCTLESLF